MWQHSSLTFVILSCRSSRSQMFFKINVLQIFAIFTGKHLSWSLFFNIVADLNDFSYEYYIYRCFPMNITKFLRTPFFKDYLRWLLLLFFYFSNEMSCIDIRLKRDIHMLFRTPYESLTYANLCDMAIGKCRQI